MLRTYCLLKIDKLILLPLGPGQTKSAKGRKKPLPSKKQSLKKLKNKSLLCTAKKYSFK